MKRRKSRLMKLLSKFSDEYSLLETINLAHSTLIKPMLSEDNAYYIISEHTVDSPLFTYHIYFLLPAPTKPGAGRILFPHDPLTCNGVFCVHIAISPLEVFVANSDAVLAMPYQNFVDKVDCLPSHVVDAITELLQEATSQRTKEEVV